MNIVGSIYVPMARAVFVLSRARDGTFFSRFSFSLLPSSLSLSLSLVIVDRFRHVSRVSRYRFPPLDSRLLRRRKSQRAKIRFPGLLDSALRLERFRIMDRTDRTLSRTLLPPSPPRNLTLIFLLPGASLSPSTFLFRSSAAPKTSLRFNLTRYYYVFHRDSSLVIPFT